MGRMQAKGGDMMRHTRPRPPADDATHKRIVDALRQFLATREEIIVAYVHGSYAEGRPFRDLDIAVYVNEAALSESPLSYELMLESELQEALREEGLRVPLDVRVLNRAPLSFRYEVIKRGTPVFVRNDDLRADFEAATISRYLDFAPFRREQLREVLGLGAE